MQNKVNKRIKMVSKAIASKLKMTKMRLQYI